MTESPLGPPGEDLATGQVPQVPVAFEDPSYLAAVIDLRGVIAYGEISAFERLAEDVVKYNYTFRF